MTRRRSDLVGRTFGQLLVCAYEGNSRWLCWCRCGNFKDVRTDNLKSGNTLACGCLNRQLHSERFRTMNYKRKYKTKDEIKRTAELHRAAVNLVNTWFGKH